MANINGWGRGTWGQLTFGEPLPVILTAPAAGTSALGAVVVDAEANVIPTGQVGTTGAPQAGVNAQAIASVPGLSGSVGSLSVAVDGEAIVTLTGSGTVGTSALGTATLITNNNLSVTGFSMTGSTNAGGLVVNSDANVSVQLDSATGATGTILVWSMVDDSQTPNWVAVDDSQTPNWENVA
jgi:hypothetical protein|tara:strand:- start:278 stop:823 length:546 start_codon:yes stop_codon:yes gene_type:complete